VFEEPNNGGEETYNRYRQPDPVRLGFFVISRAITGRIGLGVFAANIEAKVEE
jgi:hypothetical protein